ncbi:MAG: DUF2341 domain-containing protein, partial [Candidatus Peribacteraceae bacterium]|nr:DUF2341 domain-containing protein [Candidatus Peribacteraceae bacterium]
MFLSHTKHSPARPRSRLIILAVLAFLVTAVTLPQARRIASLLDEPSVDGTEDGAAADGSSSDTSASASSSGNAEQGGVPESSASSFASAASVPPVSSEAGNGDAASSVPSSSEHAPDERGTATSSVSSSSAASGNSSSETHAPRSSMQSSEPTRLEQRLLRLRVSSSGRSGSADTETETGASAELSASASSLTSTKSEGASGSGSSLPSVASAKGNVSSESGSGQTLSSSSHASTASSVSTGSGAQAGSGETLVSSSLSTGSAESSLATAEEVSSLSALSETGAAVSVPSTGSGTVAGSGAIASSASSVSSISSAIPIVIEPAFLDTDRLAANIRPSFLLPRQREIGNADELSSRLSVRLADGEGNAIPVTWDVTPQSGNYRVTVSLPNPFAPGVYHLSATLDAARGESRAVRSLLRKIGASNGGDADVIDTDVSLGFTAMNVNRSTPRSGESLIVTAGVADTRGAPLCGGNFSVRIREPGGYTSVFSTADRSIAAQESCATRAFSTLPDYAFTFPLPSPGTTTVTAERGEETFSENIRATDDSEGLSIVRDSVTRSSPNQEERMTITVTPEKSFEGTITERVPHGFEILSSDPRAEQGLYGAMTTLTWRRRWEAGVPVTLTYAFRSPDASPLFGLFGPLRAEGTIVGINLHPETQQKTPTETEETETTAENTETGASLGSTGSSQSGALSSSLASSAVSTATGGTATGSSVITETGASLETRHAGSTLSPQSESGTSSSAMTSSSSAKASSEESISSAESSNAASSMEMRDIPAEEPNASEKRADAEESETAAENAEQATLGNGFGNLRAQLTADATRTATGSGSATFDGRKVIGKIWQITMNSARQTIGGYAHTLKLLFLDFADAFFRVNHLVATLTTGNGTVDFSMEEPRQWQLLVLEPFDSAQGRQPTTEQPALTLDPVGESHFDAVALPSFRLLSVTLSGSDLLDAEGNLKEEIALREIVSATTDEETIRKEVLESIVEGASAEIATAITEDQIALSALAGTKRGSRMREEAARKAEEALNDETTKERIAEALKDEPKVQEMLETATTQRVKEIVVGNAVQESLGSTVNPATITAAVEQSGLTTDIAGAAVIEAMDAEPAMKKEVISSVIAAAQNTSSASSVSSASSPILQVKLTDKSGRQFSPKYHFEQGSVILVLEPEREFTPGLYTLTVTVLNPLTGESQEKTQDFAWGVLAMNLNQDRYTTGDKVRVAIGVLDDAGAIVCDAAVGLSVTAPGGAVTELSTTDQSVRVTGTCGEKDSRSVSPDYEAFFSADEPGEYTLKLTAKTENGTRSMEQKVEVRGNPGETNNKQQTSPLPAGEGQGEGWPIVISRKAATRLYPVGSSPMEITVKFNEDFEGTVTDTVPGSFVLSNITPPSGKRLAMSDKQTGNEQQIVWTGSWKAGETALFSYVYDAPDVSPDFFTVGPLTFVSGADDSERPRASAASRGGVEERSPASPSTSSGLPRFREARQWQLANDDIIPVSKALLFDARGSFVADVYDQVLERDGVWATAPQNGSIRVTFLQTLTNRNDITIYAQPADPGNGAAVAVYPVYEEADGSFYEGAQIAQFPPITDEGEYTVYLTNLTAPTDRFDLKILGGDLAFDHIVDPIAWLTGWSYRKAITIDNTNVDADLSYFPLLVKFTADADIGDHALATGYDIRFTDSSGNELLPYERESWTGGAGADATGIFWVRVPTVSGSADTTLYMYYGKPDAPDDWTVATSTITNCTEITNAQCVWKENDTQSFAGVWHLGETGTGSAGDYQDSTSNGNDSTNTSDQPTATSSGQVNGAESFDGTNDRIRILSPVTFTFGQGWTVSLWGKVDTNSNRAYFGDGDVNARWSLAGTGDVYVSNDANEYQNFTPTLALVGNWRQIVLRGDGNSYIDGIYQHKYTADGTFTFRDIGQGYPDYHFDGLIDEVRISAAARSADWIKFEYYNQSEADSEISLSAEEQNIVWLSGWTNRKKITIDHTKVGSGAENETDFPVLISLSDLTDINANGTDIRFTSSDGTTQLAREIESYSSGTLVAWVKVPTLSYTEDTVIYMYYGNASAEEPAADSAYGSQNVWDSNFAGVWHGKEGASDWGDSTSNGNTGTNNGVTAATGQVDGAGSFNGDLVKRDHYGDYGTGDAHTISVWIKTDYRHVGAEYILLRTTSVGAQGSATYGFAFFSSGGITYIVEGHISEGNVASEYLNDGYWHYLVGTYNGETATFYIDDEIVKEYIVTNELTGDFVLLIGGIDFSIFSNRDFNGSIDEPRISAVARSAGWISTEYNNQSSPSTFYTVESQGNEIVWTNGSGDGLWSTASNWQGGTVPGANDTAVFNDTATGNCT